MMAIANDKARASGRNAVVKAAFILGANLVVAALVGGLVAALTDGDTFHPSGTSEGMAALVGWLHASFGATAAALRASAQFLSDAEEAEDLRQEGRALLLGAAALVAAGASLVLLSVSGSGGPASPKTIAATALVLNAPALILVTVRWQGLDELNRAMARDAGYLALNWLSLVGGTWAVLAHLELASAPTPLNWLTMIAGFSFMAGLVALARRGGFDTPA